jgi:hypothetical protein
MGMTGGCPPPSLGSQELVELKAAQGHQYAGPLTLRFLAQPLFLAPASVKRQIGELLLRGGSMEDLLLVENPDLDREVPQVMRIDVRAPMRAIHDSVEEFVKRHKKALGAREVRRRDDSLGDYLAAWDAREGWVGGGYDAAKEKRLREVAAGTHDKLFTVQTRYKTAFRIITGLEYDPGLWFDLFVPLKISASKLAGWRRKKRGRNPGGPKVITETTLCQPKADGEGRSGLDGFPSEGDESAFYDVEVKLDIEALAKAGKTEEEIALELEVDQATVRWFLGRQADGL